MDSLPSPGRLILRAVRSSRRHPIATFLGLPLTLALAVVGCLIPRLNFAFILLMLAPVMGSLPCIALAVARDDALRFDASLLGFRRFERFLALFWVPYLVVAGCSAPVLLALWIDRHITSDAAWPWLLASSVTLALALVTVVLHRYLLAPFVAADVDRGVSFPEMLADAVALTEPPSLATGWRWLVIALFSLSGVLLGGVGLSVTLPVGLVAWAHLYLAIRQRAMPLNDSVLS